MRIGLTGGLASGKSAVAERLARLGAVVIDADELAREAVAPGTSGLAEVVAAFGTDVLAADGTLDRAALARLVFADEAARRRLEAIVHPRVRELAAEREAAAEAGAVVVHVIPLLVETGQVDDFDEVVVVDVPPQVQLERYLARSGESPTQARARLAAQATRAERLAAADTVVGNSGTLAELAEKVDRLWARWEAVERPRSASGR